MASLPHSATRPQPDLTRYLSAGPAGRPAVIIFPGGGYNKLAPHEGEDYARFFAAHGIDAFVTRYRLGSDGHRHPAMLEDAAAAIYTVRTAAPEWGIDPARIGVVGSSAGGHLAACLLTLHQRFDPLPVRPDFGILCYPVITLTGPHAHQGSARSLLGPKPDPQTLHELSCQFQVTASTPPCFLWHTFEDSAVPAANSSLFAESLHHHRIPAELHIWPHGHHGLGLRANLPWGNLAVAFIHRLTTTDSVK